MPQYKVGQEVRYKPVGGGFICSNVVVTER